MSLSQMTDQVPSKSDQKLAEWIINWYLQKSATRKKLVPPCSHGLSRFFAGAQFIIWRITMSRHHSCVISSRQALPSKWIWWDSNRYKHYYIDSLRARTMWEPPPGKEQCCNSLIISNYISWAIFPHLESNPLMGTAALMTCLQLLPAIRGRPNPRPLFKTTTRLSPLAVLWTDTS